MLLNCTKHIASSGVPIYVERIPGIESFSVAVVMFVGSADDRSIGEEGLFHWFEHAPFRGTKLFPGGANEFDARYGRHAATCNASTSRTRTTFVTHTPMQFWREGLLFPMSLAACPLLYDEHIEAERRIIEKEKTERTSDPMYDVHSCISEHKFGSGHPMSGDTLGTDESLQGMSSNTVRRAHIQGYSWNRTALFVSGDVSLEDIVAEVDSFIAENPLSELSERRTSQSYGKVVFKPGTITGETKTNASHLNICLPLSFGTEDFEERAAWIMTNAVLGHGMSNPLMHDLREERQLVYGVGTSLSFGPNIFEFAVHADTRTKHIDEILARVDSVLNGEVARSSERLEWVRDNMRGAKAFIALSTRTSLQLVQRTTNLFGEPLCYSDVIRLLCAVPHEAVLARLDSLASSERQRFVFKGTD